MSDLQELHFDDLEGTSIDFDTELDIDEVSIDIDEFDDSTDLDSVDIDDIDVEDVSIDSEDFDDLDDVEPDNMLNAMEHSEITDIVNLFHAAGISQRSTLALMHYSNKTKDIAINRDDFPYMPDDAFGALKSCINDSNTEDLSIGYIVSTINEVTGWSPSIDFTSFKNKVNELIELRNLKSVNKDITEVIGIEQDSINISTTVINLIDKPFSSINSIVSGNDALLAEIPSDIFGVIVKAYYKAVYDSEVTENTSIQCGEIINILSWFFNQDSTLEFIGVDNSKSMFISLGEKMRLFVNASIDDFEEVNFSDDLDVNIKKTLENALNGSIVSEVIILIYFYIKIMEISVKKNDKASTSRLNIAKDFFYIFDYIEKVKELPILLNIMPYKMCIKNNIGYTLFYGDKKVISDSPLYEVIGTNTVLRFFTLLFDEENNVTICPPASVFSEVNSSIDIASTRSDIFKGDESYYKFVYTSNFVDSLSTTNTDIDSTSISVTEIKDSILNYSEFEEDTKVSSAQLKVYGVGYILVLYTGEFELSKLSTSCSVTYPLDFSGISKEDFISESSQYISEDCIQNGTTLLYNPDNNSIAITIIADNGDILVDSIFYEQDYIVCGVSTPSCKSNVVKDYIYGVVSDAAQNIPDLSNAAMTACDLFSRVYSEELEIADRYISKYLSVALPSIENVNTILAYGILKDMYEYFNTHATTTYSLGCLHDLLQNVIGSDASYAVVSADCDKDTILSTISGARSKILSEIKSIANVKLSQEVCETLSLIALVKEPPEEDISTSFVKTLSDIPCYSGFMKYLENLIVILGIVRDEDVSSLFMGERSFKLAYNSKSRQVLEHYAEKIINSFKKPFNQNARNNKSDRSVFDLTSKIVNTTYSDRNKTLLYYIISRNIKGVIDCVGDSELKTEVERVVKENNLNINNAFDCDFIISDVSRQLTNLLVHCLRSVCSKEHFLTIKSFEMLFTYSHILLYSSEDVELDSNRKIESMVYPYSFIASYSPIDESKISDEDLLSSDISSVVRFDKTIFFSTYINNLDEDVPILNVRVDNDE